MQHTLQESELSIYEYWHKRDNEDSARLRIWKPYVFELGKFHTLPCKEITPGMIEAGKILELNTNNRSTEIDQYADTIAAAIDSQEQAHITHKLVLGIMSLSDGDYQNILNIGEQYRIAPERCKEIILQLLQYPQTTSRQNPEKQFIEHIRGILSEDKQDFTTFPEDSLMYRLQEGINQLMQSIKARYSITLQEEIMV